MYIRHTQSNKNRTILIQRHKGLFNPDWTQHFFEIRHISTSMFKYTDYNNTEKSFQLK